MSPTRGGYGFGGGAPPVDAPPLTPADRQVVDNYLQYRLKLAANPFAAASLPPTMGQFTPGQRHAADGVFLRMHDLLRIQTKHLEDDTFLLKAEKEALMLAVARFRETLTIEQLKLVDTAAFLQKVQDVLQKGRHVEMTTDRESDGDATGDAASDSLRGGMPRTTLDLPSQFLPRNDKKGLSSSSSAKTKQGGGGGGTSISSSLIEDPRVLTSNVELTMARVKVLDALTCSLDVCPTVAYPEIVESISKLVKCRRRLEYERAWCDAADGELLKVKTRVENVAQLQSTHETEFQQERRLLEEAHRDIFAKRKSYIVLHKQLFGAQRLPSGVLLSSGSTVEIVDRIRAELGAHKTTTLDMLADGTGHALDALLQGKKLPGPSTVSRQYVDRADDVGGGGSSRSQQRPPLNTEEDGGGLAAMSTEVDGYRASANADIRRIRGALGLPGANSGSASVVQDAYDNRRDGWVRVATPQYDVSPIAPVAPASANTSMASSSLSSRVYTTRPGLSMTPSSSHTTTPALPSR